MTHDVTKPMAAAGLDPSDAEASKAFLMGVAFAFGRAWGESRPAARDELIWRTSKEGKKYQLDTESGQIVKGNLGQMKEMRQEGLEKAKTVDLKGHPEIAKARITAMNRLHRIGQEKKNARPSVDSLYKEGKRAEARDARRQEVEETEAFTLPLRQAYLEQNLEAIRPKQGEPFTGEAAMDRLAFDDKTGHCASLALGYAAMRAGYDIEIGRGEESRAMVATMTDGIAQEAGGVVRLDRGVSKRAEGLRDPAYTQKLVDSAIQKAMKPGKEYMLSAGGKNSGHAAIVRLGEDGHVEYLELQSKNDRGWKKWDADTWARFGCPEKRITGVTCGATIVDLDGLAKSDSFKAVLPYINKKRG